MFCVITFPYHLFIKTALQVYCQAYKQAPIGQAHGLLRKARRLDNILNVRSEATVTIVPANSVEPQCHRCHTQFSPAFYPLAEPPSTVNGQQNTLDMWECHRCHFEASETRGKSMDIMVS